MLLPAANGNTKVERSSEKLRPTVPKEKLTQSKCRSLDTAAKQTRLAVDARTDSKPSCDRVPADSRKADRQCLRQLAINKVCSLFFLILILVFDVYFLSVNLLC